MTSGTDAGAARYAVVGHPVGHSLSPRIHAHFARQTGESLVYEAIEIAPGEFEPRIRALQQQGYAGLNVTLPFKQEAWSLCDETSARAALAAAVNTLLFAADGGIRGDNTDGAGLVRDLTLNLGIDIAGRHLLVLGAGGAVRGVLGPLLELAPAGLTLANRTPEKAIALARDFADLGPIAACEFAALEGRRFDLVINGTAAGIDDEVPPLPAGVVRTAGAGYDMMYRLDAPTAFVGWLRQQGIDRAHDGLGMLVEQAAEAFFLWRGVRPDSAALIAGLRPA